MSLFRYLERKMESFENGSKKCLSNESLLVEDQLLLLSLAESPIIRIIFQR